MNSFSQKEEQNQFVSTNENIDGKLQPTTPTTEEQEGPLFESSELKYDSNRHSSTNMNATVMNAGPDDSSVTKEKKNEDDSTDDGQHQTTPPLTSDSNSSVAFSPSTTSIIGNNDDGQNINKLHSVEEDGTSPRQRRLTTPITNRPKLDRQSAQKSLLLIALQTSININDDNNDNELDTSTSSTTEEMETSISKKQEAQKAHQQQYNLEPPLELSTTEGVVKIPSPEKESDITASSSSNNSTKQKKNDTNNPLRASRIVDAQRALTGNFPTNSSSINMTNTIPGKSRFTRRDFQQQQRQSRYNSTSAINTSNKADDGILQHHDEETSNSNLPQRLSPATRSVSWSHHNTTTGGSSEKAQTLSAEAAASRRAAFERKSREMFGMPSPSVLSSSTTTTIATRNNNIEEENDSDSDDNQSQKNEGESNDGDAVDYRNDNDTTPTNHHHQQQGGLLEDSDDLFMPGAYKVTGSRGDQISSSLEWSIADMNFNIHDLHNNGDDTTNNLSSVAEGGAGAAAASSSPSSLLLSSSSNRNTAGESTRGLHLVNAVLVEEDYCSSDDDADDDDDRNKKRASLQAWEEELGRKQRELELQAQQQQQEQPWHPVGISSATVPATTTTAAAPANAAFPAVVSTEQIQYKPTLPISIRNDLRKDPPAGPRRSPNGIVLSDHTVNGCTVSRSDHDYKKIISAANTGVSHPKQSAFTTFKNQSMVPFLTYISSPLVSNLEIKDRIYHHGKTYQRCFVACEAIDLMINMNIVDSRDEAVILGRLLQDIIGLWHHVGGKSKHGFKDEYLLFRLNSDQKGSDSSSQGKLDTPPAPPPPPQAIIGKPKKNRFRKILKKSGSTANSDLEDSQHSHSSNGIRGSRHLPDIHSNKNKKKKNPLRKILHNSRSSGVTDGIQEDGSIPSFGSRSERDSFEQAEHFAI